MHILHAALAESDFFLKNELFFHIFLVICCKFAEKQLETFFETFFYRKI